MSRCYIVFVFCMLAFSMSAKNLTTDNATSSDRETEISGIVRNDAGKPLSSVMIRLSFAEKDGPYVMTDKNGSYTLKVSTVEQKVCLNFSKIGFESEKRIIDNTTQHLDITLLKSASTLREVTVKAPDVKIQGDTITYLLSSFMGKGDVSLKDALKKVPGIAVASSGEISYNGKKISKFYIEGMDMLGGKYDIATTNIPASYVNAVEVLNNHQDIKIDRRIFNDNVALNIRLKPKAKFRPTGTYTLSGGYGEKPVPLGASGAGMMFRDDFQSILTLKGSDIEEFSNRENFRFYDSGRSRLTNLASDVLGHLSASNPPLARNRWIKPIDASTSVNFVNKISDDISLRTNVDYSFLKTKYGYTSSRFYFDGISDILIRQLSQPESRKHTPSFSVEYRINSDNLYFTNDFSGSASFSSDQLPVTTNSEKIRQHQEMSNFNIRDILYWGWKRGKVRWNYTSAIEYLGAPKGVIEISDNTLNSSHLMQTGRSYSFLANESLSGEVEIKRSRIFLPLSIAYSNEKVRSGLLFAGDGIGTERTDMYHFTESNVNGSKNRIDGSTLRAAFSPEYYYASRYDQLVLRVNCPIGMEYLNINNNGTVPLKNQSVHFLFNPSLYLNYKLSAKSVLRFNSSYGSKTGDLLDLLTAPIMTDYLSMSYRSGILLKQNTFSATLHYDFKLPISLWFVNAEASYIHTQSNLLSCQDVSAGLIAATNKRLPNSTDLIHTQLGISKSIREINAKISLKGTYDRSRNEILQNDLLVNYYTTATNLTGELACRALDWLEMGYNATLSTNLSRYLGRKQSFSTQSHKALIAFYPVATLQIKAETDITRREIEPHRYKTNSFFDAQVVYKFKKFRFSLKFRNILNCKNYSYTIFSGLDKFTYDYTLRGRELIAKLEFSL